MLPLKVSPFGTFDHFSYKTCNLGAARLSYPDPAAPEYNQCFVRAANRDAFKRAATSPYTVPCCESGEIKGEINIFVDPVCAIHLFCSHSPIMPPSQVLEPLEGPSNSNL
jgi:hypothetical protein